MGVMSDLGFKVFAENRKLLKLECLKLSYRKGPLIDPFLCFCLLTSSQNYFLPRFCPVKSSLIYGIFFGLCNQHMQPAEAEEALGWPLSQ